MFTLVNCIEVIHFTKPHISPLNTSMDQSPEKSVLSLQKICTDFLYKSGVLNITQEGRHFVYWLQKVIKSISVSLYVMLILKLNQITISIKSLIFQVAYTAIYLISILSLQLLKVYDQLHEGDGQLPKVAIKLLCI